MMLSSTAASIEEKSLGILARVTHDLKSPMNAIISALDYISKLTKEGRIDPKELQDILSIARIAGDDMSQLIHSILVTARLEAGKEYLEPAPVNDLHRVLQEFVSAFKFEAVLRKQQLVLEVGSELPEVYWDIRKIHYHIFNNLISNALKFVPSEGTIRISAQSDQNDIVIKVSDNGPGIPPDARRKIFDRFERAEVAPERAHQGFGLGLYSAHLYTRTHQGTIHIEDGLDGKGVAFVVRLPRYPTFRDDKALSAEVNAELHKQLQNYWIHNLAI